MPGMIFDTPNSQQTNQQKKRCDKIIQNITQLTKSPFDNEIKSFIHSVSSLPVSMNLESKRVMANGTITAQMNDATLAAVIGHEITHYTYQRVKTSQQNQALQSALPTQIKSLNDHQQQESMCDVVGIRMAQRTGHKNTIQGVTQFFTNQYNKISTNDKPTSHPDLSARIQFIQKVFSDKKAIAAIDQYILTD